MFIGKYKILTIYSNNPDKFTQVLAELNIPLGEELRTVWDNFSQENPGIAESINVGGKDIYNLVESFKGRGLYFKEHRIC